MRTWALVLGGLVLVLIASGLADKLRPTPRPTGASTAAPRSSKTTTAPEKLLSTQDHLVAAQTAIEAKDYDKAVNELTFIRKGDAEYGESRKLEAVALKGAKAAKLARLEKEGPALRESLRSEYQAVMTGANPHLNFIDSKLTKVKGGWALWATHEYFSRYTFTIGNNGPLGQRWIK
jgi:hypothetical protein